MVDASLQDTAAMSMCRNLHTVAGLGNRVVNELIVLWRQPIQATLDYVVAVEILDKCYNMIRQGLFGNGDLFGGGEELDHLLNCASAVHILRYLDEIRGDLLDDL